MKAKLIKKSENHYDLHVDGVGLYTSTYQWSSNGNLLSLKNCQAIERGYDLDELAEKHINYEPHTAYILQRKFDFIDGFQKALEILGDKKFSEENIHQALHLRDNISSVPIIGEALDIISKIQRQRDQIIQSLQQNEWEVEIEMEEVAIGDKYTPEPKPKLDADGCLILKRV